jgi:hypothetical protein
MTLGHWIVKAILITLGKCFCSALKSCSETRNTRVVDRVIVTLKPFKPFTKGGESKVIRGR